jgi:hypothetical protein
MILVDQVLLSDSLNVDLTKLILNSILLSDSAIATRLKTVTESDDLLLDDATLIGAVRGLLETDNLFLRDDDNRTLIKTMLLPLFLSDGVIPALGLTLTDYLLLDDADSQTFIRGQVSNIVSELDALFLSDSDQRTLEMVVQEAALLADTVAASRVAADTLLLDDTTIRVMDRVLADEILLMDYATKQREARFLDDLFLLDSVIASRFADPTNAFPLTFAAIRAIDLLGMKTDNVDFMFPIAGKNSNLVGGTVEAIWM